MARLDRPYIPLAVRVLVAERQLANKVGLVEWERIALSVFGPPSLKARLDDVLKMLFPNQRAELHHRPALVNRQRRNGKYIPDANDPAHLIYLAEDDHDIETRVRGQNGQFSDLALRRREKRRQRKRVTTKKIMAKRARSFQKGIKRKWPSRPFPKGRRT